jgi:RNA polymerase sigma factor (TIGR02999 family)
MADAHEVSVLLGELRNGNREAAPRLTAAIYPELHRIADHYLRQERPGHTLQATALVNETWARLFGVDRGDWQNRAHFFAAIATEMRRILVDHARARNAQKRPDKQLAVSLGAIADIGVAPDQDLVALDEALRQFEAVDARAARAVELRFFTGLTEPEAAEALGISVSTLKRDWEYARAWLFEQLRG